MRVVLWCTAAVLVLSAVVATPAQAGFPSCREVTEKIPSEYMEGRYLRISPPTVEQWREWNGYAGLQTHKCETEYGVLLGSDTFVASVDATQPDPPAFPPLPTPPGVPEAPDNPGLCRSGDDPTLGQIIQACTDLPDMPGIVPGQGECAVTVSGLVAFLQCLTRSEEPPTAAYVNWLQYVVGWIGEG